MGKRKTPRADRTSYEIGHGKPPKQYQFKKGQSGNPGGRRKESVNLATIFERVALTEIELNENGRRRKVVIPEALALTLAKKGLSGDVRAITQFLDLWATHMPQSRGDENALPEEDLAILQRVLNPDSPFHGLPMLSNTGAEEEKREEDEELEELDDNE